MKNFLLLFLIFFSTLLRASAVEIVYPKTNPVKIDSASTFFIGSANPSEILIINGIQVKVSPSGAFAQVVDLDVGINNFKIISGDNLLDFEIERPQPRPAIQNITTLIDYPMMNNFYVSTDNAPLRMTPVDSGVNRLSHLQKDTQLLLNGEKGDFYRVYLNSKLYGWIAKTNVEQRPTEQEIPQKIQLKEFKTKDEKDFCLYEFELSGKPLFILKEESAPQNGLTLQLFNIDGQEDSTYCLNIPAQKIFGYEVSYKDEKFVLKVRKNSKIDLKNPLNSIVIAVDAGHGGTEYGAIGCCGDKEKDINLAIAKNLQQELELRGAKVVMTRKDDINVSLDDRIKTAKENDAEILVSVHANALPDGADPIKNKGTSVYYYHNQAKSLAECILNSMTTKLGTQNDKVRQGSLALVRPTSSVSVLIEVAYIINPDDYALLLDKKFQSDCAKAIAEGIEKYLLN